MTCLDLKIDYSDYGSDYFNSSGGRGIRLSFASRGLGTPLVRVESVPVPASTSNKMASSDLQIQEEVQLPDRPEPAQISRDRSLKQTKSKNTRPRGHLT